MTAWIKLSQQKTEIEKSAKGARKLVKTCPKSLKTAKWPNLDISTFLSPIALFSN